MSLFHVEDSSGMHETEWTEVVIPASSSEALRQDFRLTSLDVSKVILKKIGQPSKSVGETSSASEEQFSLKGFICRYAPFMCSLGIYIPFTR
jgi:hypothetical protein